jgi:hypothetical protein
MSTLSAHFFVYATKTYAVWRNSGLESESSLFDSVTWVKMLTNNIVKAWLAGPSHAYFSHAWDHGTRKGCRTAGGPADEYAG